MPEPPTAARANPSAVLTPVRVWDLPTRIFHWTLAVTVIASLATGFIGGNATVWHMRLGLLAMALLVFRLLWGLVGGHWSRFTSFIYSPATTLRYLRGGSNGDTAHLDVGHSPVGALSVFALLGLLVAQVATGLVADDEIATTGPLNRFVASATGLAATAWHRGFGKSILIVLIVMHVAAIVVYWRRGRNLVRPMLGGDKTLGADVPASRDTAATRLLALVIAAAAAALAVWLARLGG